MREQLSGRASRCQREGRGSDPRLPLTMYHVYILQSKTTGKYYIGSTNDLVRRLKEHNSNQTASLRNKGPSIVIYKEEFNTLAEARRREYKIKSYKGGNAFKKLLEAQNAPPGRGGRRFNPGLALQNFKNYLPKLDKPT